MKNDKLITVLMSVYNTPADQLRLSIESILNQTYSDFYFLIIDDFSTNDSSKIIESYNDSRIIYIKNEQNLGLAASLNKGLELIKTKYIARMDSDDIAYLNRLEKQLEFAKKHDEYSIISGRADQFDENGIYKQIGKTGVPTINDLVKGAPFIHPTMLIKTKDLKKIGGYPNYRRAQDYAMEMDLYANGMLGYVMDDVLIKYRMDNDGYKKKKFRYRVLEFKIRFKYFKKMKVNFFKYVYVFKPIFVGLIPKKLLKRFQRNR